MRVVGLLATLALLATAASAQPSAVHPNIAVYLNGFDVASNTYSGMVRIGGQPSPDVSYGVNLPVDHVRNADDARAKMADKIAKIERDIAEAAATCQKR